MTGPHSSPRPAAVLTAVIAVLALLLAGCVGVPDDGSVRASPEQEQEQQPDAPFDFTPSGPRPGATPVDVVEGFLLAMQAWPLSTAVAREYLTAEGNASWVPERSTLVYGSHFLNEVGASVTTDFEETVRLDASGRWLGDDSDGEGVRFRLEMAREKGEWRISNPPDALVIPQSYFEQRFDQYFLYFFDQTARVLVPEPVHLPRGEQAPTMLVRRLLRGPEDRLAGTLRTFIPEDTDLEFSVPVSRQGVAEVPLSPHVLDLKKDQLDNALAQLAWTLRQVSGVDAMQVTVGGSPLDVPGEGNVQDVDGWNQYDPTVQWASEELFGIREGRVVVHSGDTEQRIAGPFGTEDHDLRSIGVDLPAEQVAAVTADGSQVVVAPRGATEERSRQELEVVYSGTDVLRPAWDIYGHVWLVDRTPSGASVTVLRGGRWVEPVAPGLAGRDVKAFALSRDGSRLVAVVSGDGGDRLVIARVVRGAEGEVVRLSRATPLPLGAIEVDEIRDLAWHGPGAVAVLAGTSASSSQVLFAVIDGSSELAGVDMNAEIFRDQAVELVTSAASAAPLYVGSSSGQLFELASDGQWNGTSIRPGLRSPTFVG